MLKTLDLCQPEALKIILRTRMKMMKMMSCKKWQEMARDGNRPYDPCYLISEQSTLSWFGAPTTFDSCSTKMRNPWIFMCLKKAWYDGLVQIRVIVQGQNVIETLARLGFLALARITSRLDNKMDHIHIYCMFLALIFLR